MFSFLYNITLQGKNNPISYSSSNASLAKYGLQAQITTYSCISFHVFFILSCTSIVFITPNHCSCKLNFTSSNASKNHVCNSLVYQNLSILNVIN
ncbi:MAG: hypothetical protein Q8S84_09035 [bacterium]|nr:hypothetical protein [bacterium]MDP3381567.1 hypothetical protein [bacterium]